METRTETQTERANHVRMVVMENETYSDRRSECAAQAVESLADVAIALDKAAGESIEKHGGCGTGAGAWLEAIILDTPDGDPAAAAGERVSSVEDAVFAHLPPGDPKSLRRFIAAKSRAERGCWDGHNFVPSPTWHAQALLQKIRGRTT